MVEDSDWWELIPSPIKFRIPDDLIAIDGRVNKQTIMYYFNVFGGPMVTRIID